MTNTHTIRAKHFHFAWVRLFDERFDHLPFVDEQRARIYSAKHRVDTGAVLVNCPAGYQPGYLD